MTVEVIGVLATSPDTDGIVKLEESWALPKPVNVPVPLTAIARPPDAEFTVALALNAKVEFVWAGSVTPRKNKGKAILSIYY